MEKNKKTILFSISIGVMLFFCSNFPGSMAQDAHFSQFFANPMFLNPAFAGSAYCPRIILNYRNQWPGLTGTFVTYAASYDQFVESVDGGIGFSVLHDKAGEGTLNTTNASLIYSYNRNITRNFSVKAALQVTFFQKFIDWDKLTFGDMIDARYGFIYPTQETPITNSKKGVDFSAGILGQSRRVSAGFSAHHLTQPDEGLLGYSKLPLKYAFHTSLTIPLKNGGDESSVSPNILFMQQANFHQLNLGIYVKKGPIVTGFWFRMDDSFILLLGIYRGKIKIGYSYDITISKLSSGNTFGSHEISLQHRFNCRKRTPKIKEIDCPDADF